MDKKEIEKQIRTLFELWVSEKKKEKLDKVRYAGPVLEKEEYDGLLDAIFSDWWSGGKYSLQAEKDLAEFSGRNFGLLANSGSSANLLLMSAAKELYFKNGDKILTLSCGFPTTINPIINNRLIPLFVDIDLEDFGLNPELLTDALKKDKKIKGVFIAHTLGFKGKIDEILSVCEEHNVKLFFDSCDAYGTVHKGKPIQSYGIASTFSFYVAHHLTMGEGGGVVTDDPNFHLTMRGFRNWGRYCAATNCCVRALKPELFCPLGKLTQDTEVPDDYAVNYTYEWMGYNLKPLEIQAAILIAQIKKLKRFDGIRKKNYRQLYNHFSKITKYNFKTWQIDDDISPFSFPLLIPKDAKFSRKDLVSHMSKNKIETRLLFGGNLTKHPAYANSPDDWQMFGEQKNSDTIMEDFIMFGVSQVNEEHHIDKVITEMDAFLNKW
jgi:CDP-6-deoxy-D-xylo-4-hexulose-3-dehydrase